MYIRNLFASVLPLLGFNGTRCSRALPCWVVFFMTLRSVCFRLQWPRWLGRRENEQSLLFLYLHISIFKTAGKGCQAVLFRLSCKDATRLFVHLVDPAFWRVGLVWLVWAGRTNVRRGAWKPANERWLATVAWMQLAESRSYFDVFPDSVALHPGYGLGRASLSMHNGGELVALIRICIQTDSPFCVGCAARTSKSMVVHTVHPTNTCQLESKLE